MGTRLLEHFVTVAAERNMTAAAYRLLVVALLPPTHPLASEAGVSLTQLAGENWVDVLPGSGTRVQLERELERRCLTRRVIVEVGTLPSVPVHVAAGLGVGVVPNVLDTSGCVALPLLDDFPSWTLSIAMRRGGSRRPVVAACIDAVQAHAAMTPTADASGESGRHDERSC